MTTIEDETDSDVVEEAKQARLEAERENTKYGDGISGKAGGKSEDDA
jgi:hypothetical protein